MTKLVGGSFASGSITTSQLAPGLVSPVITSVAITDSSYNVIDDTAANTGGGYIQITGTNLNSNCVIVIGTTTATSTTYVNNTTLRAQVQSFPAATYPVYVIDSYDGSTAIKVNGITFSNTPIWGTGTTLSNQTSGTAFGINVSANSDSSITYSNTTSLPSGTSLLANGYFYGTVTVGSDTTYNFTVKANDAENQDASRTFSVTITAPPQYKLWTWGYNAQGQLGQNNVVAKSSPIQLGSETDWSKIGISDNSYGIMSIKTDGTLWALGGINSSGQLGLNNGTQNRSSPVQVGALTNWSLLDLGGNSGSAIKTDGTLWLWGDNTYGQLGQNDRVHRSSPVQVGALTNWSKISIGGTSTIFAGIKTDGTLWVMGAGSGSLGLSNNTSRSSPTQVGALTNWNFVSVGGYVTVATKTDGTLWAWGDNSQGQLGLNNRINTSSPIQIGSGTTWSQISSGGPITIATKTDGTLWVWGQNTEGELGLNDISRRSSPTQVGTDTNWSNISSATYGVLATKTNGTMWGFGYNNTGQLGVNDTITYRSSPTQVGNGTNWNVILAGGGSGFSSSAAITRD